MRLLLTILSLPLPLAPAAVACCSKPLLAPSGSCVPYTEGHYSLGVWQQVVQMSKDILGQQYRVPLIDTFKWTVRLHFAHIPLAGNGWDCLHYCRPGLSEVRSYLVGAGLTGPTACAVVSNGGPPNACPADM
jgi:hypothetical protein